MKPIFCTALSLSLFFLAACSKEEGKGGTLTLQGKVWVNDYTSNGNYKGSYYGMDEDVYIVYGNSPVYNDKTSTHYDGTYRFTNLYPGTYTVYTYSDCDTCISGEIPVVQTLTIEGKGETIELPDLVVRK